MLIKLYILFVKYGLLCFGGGYALVPLLLSDLTEHYRLITPETFGALVSIAQITPGAIGLNIATFVGMLQGGVPGAILTSLGLLTPSFMLIPILMRTLHHGQETRFIKGFMMGIRPAALGLVLCAGVIFSGMSAVDLETGHINPLALIIVIASAIGFYKNLSPVTLILCGAAVGTIAALI